MINHDVNVGDIVQMRKPHPCGSILWKITRTGLDIRIVCCACGRQLMLPKSQFNKQVRKIIHQPSIETVAPKA